jgi:hypothetical protein
VLAKIGRLERSKSLSKHHAKMLVKLTAKRFRIKAKGNSITNILETTSIPAVVPTEKSSSDSSSTCIEPEVVTRVSVPGMVYSNH